MWGFVRILEGPSAGGYSHDLFVRGQEDLCKQMKRVKRALEDSEWSGSTARSLSEFAFDVYAVNFQEEGAALHAQFLWEQTTFVAQVVSELVVRVVSWWLLVLLRS